MSNLSMEIFKELLERWIEEFGRAVEMFTGEKPTLTFSLVSAPLAAADLSARTWWKQVVQNDKSFSIWAGVTEAIWNSLGDGEEAQSTLFEMLGQANQGMAAVLSAGFPKPLRCQDGTVEPPNSGADTELAHVALNFRGLDAGVIFFLIEKSAFSILSPEEPAVMDLPGYGDSPQLPGLSSPAMLSRLLDLRLPVSVLLGRANITIKEALKLMPGSVIELDRQVGDHVEIIVHGTVVAKGEIVSVKGNYGVRIKEVISRQDRMALHEAA